jgi:hypothetical protein
MEREVLHHFEGLEIRATRVRKQRTNRHDAQLLLKPLLELNLARDDYEASLGLVWRVIQQSEMVRSLECTQNPSKESLTQPTALSGLGHFSAAAVGLYRQPF